MNLYLISQTENGGYDTYDSAVVCALNESDARNIHPAGEWPEGEFANYSRTWCKSPDAVSVEIIGTATFGCTPGVVLASFNAG